jgi:hypothetical protein
VWCADEDGDADVDADFSIVFWCFDDECRRSASPFKDQEEPSGVPSCLSSSFLRVEVFCLQEDKNAASSIIFFYCCLDSWTVLLSPIIVLATVVSLYMSFALSSDRLIFTCIFFSGYDLPRLND